MIADILFVLLIICGTIVVDAIVNELDLRDYCETNEDCPEGYVCVNNKVTKKEEEDVK